MPATNLYGTCANKYQDKEWFVEQYVDKNKSAAEIARICGCSDGTIYNWLRLHGIDAHKNTGNGNGMFGKRGADNPMWKGGRREHNGYILIRPEYGYPNTRADGYISEHRYNMEKHIGRPLKKDETIHHVNGDRKDNRIENLLLLENRHHVLKHYEVMGELYRLRDENAKLKVVLVAWLMAKSREV